MSDLEPRRDDESDDEFSRRKATWEAARLDAKHDATDLATFDSEEERRADAMRKATMVWTMPPNSTETPGERDDVYFEVVAEDGDVIDTVSSEAVARAAAEGLPQKATWRRVVRP